MTGTILPRTPDAETDVLYDTSHDGLARTFGRRAVEQMRKGRDPYEAARLAFTFAGRVLQERETLAQDLDALARLQRGSIH